MNRQQAGKARLQAQIGAAVLLAGAAGLLVLPLDGVLASSDPVVAGPGPGGEVTPTGPTPPFGGPDVGTAADAIVLLDRDVPLYREELPPAIAIEDEPEDPIEESPEPAATPVAWKYVGWARGSNGVRALVEIEDRQMWLRTGAERDGKRVENITPEEIVLKEGASELRIALADREQDIYSRIASSSQTGAGAKAGNANGNLSPAEELRLRQEQLQAERIERLQAERQRDNSIRPPAKPPVRPDPKSQPESKGDNPDAKMDRNSVSPGAIEKGKQVS